MFPVALLAAILTTAAPVATPSASPSPQRILSLIRAKFRSHRPPPPFETYTLVREQLTTDGYPDYVDSYKYHIWCRTSDRACLGRKVFRADYRGPLEFLRPAFNEARDPGPPTADLFEPAPVHPHPVEFVPTPEAFQTELPVIGVVSVAGEFDYRVLSLDTEQGELHLRIEPIRTPERNRLRELWVDKDTYELHKLAATDKLFIDHGPTYTLAYTVSLSMLQGTPVITEIHGDVGDGYFGDGQKPDLHFRDIAFPATLPAWYFDAHQYAAHVLDAPQ